MHVKVLSSLVISLMADGQNFLHGEKPVYSHMHFSARKWNFRPVNICIESTIKSTKGWYYWKCMLIIFLKLNFGNESCSLTEISNKIVKKLSCVHRFPQNREKRRWGMKGGCRGKVNLTFQFRLGHNEYKDCFCNPFYILLAYCTVQWGETKGYQCPNSKRSAMVPCLTLRWA